LRILNITLAATLAIASFALGQDLKVGYVQVEVLMENFPEHEDASKTYEKEVASWEKQLKQYQEEVAVMEEEYQQRAMLFSPEKKKEKEEAIMAKRQEAVQFYQEFFGPQGKAEQRKMELLKPIYDKVTRAIEILGERDVYTMIFNAQGILYANEELDLTEEVLKILKTGVDVSPSSGSRSAPRR
jgi:outer membrane protein